MNNSFYKLSSRRILFLAVVTSALLSGSSMPAWAGVPETHIALQTVKLQGKVVDVNNEPIIGANVMLKGSTTGTITDIDGNFTLDGMGDGILVVSFIGYKTLELPLKGANLSKIVLKEDSELLEEVVVVGYGAMKKESLTGSVTVVDQKIFKDKGAMANPLQAMQGQVPGVRITRSSAAPGEEGWGLSIRGAVSKNTTEPLLIIDGVPANGVSEMAQLNAADIESINFLKDASAAIYGSKAAGGVILVTTKRPNAGKAKIEYSGSYTRKIVGLQPGLMGYDEWTDAVIQAVKNDPQSTSDTWIQYAMMAKELKGQYLDLTNGHNPAEPIPGSFAGVTDLTFMDVDWNDVLWGGANSTQHDLSISGGTEKANFRLSFGYIYDGSTLKWGNNSNERYNIRLSNNFKVTDRFDIISVISASRQNQVTPTMIGGVTSSMPLRPGFAVSSMDGKPYQWGSEYGLNWLAELGGDNKLLVTNLNINETFKIQLAKGLNLNATLGYSTSDATRNIQQLSIDWYNYKGQKLETDAAPYPTQANSYYLKSSGKTDNYTASAYMNYTKTWKDTHDFSAMVGAQYDFKEYQYSAMKSKDIQSSLEVPNGSGEILIDKVERWQEALMSYFSRLNYSYKSRYLIEANARYDGSSKFQPENRWNFFYGFSGGWRITEEAFMQNIKGVLNELKLKVSYGEVGNQSGIGRYDGVQLYAYNSGGGAYLGDDRTAYVAAAKELISTNRSWERIHNYNVGLDFHLFDSRLSGSLDFYLKKNNNMLIASIYPGVLGGTAPAANNGKFESKGYDGNIRWNDRIRDFSYHVGATLSYMTNTLKSGGTDVIEAGYNKTVNGYPLNSIFGYQYVGKIQNEEQLKKYTDKFLGSNTIDLPSVIRLGDNMYQDVDGDGKLTQSDMVFLGTDDPKLSYSFDLGFEWKGIDFSANFQGVANRTIYRESDAYKVPFRTVYRNTSNYTIGNTWSPETPNNRYPAYTTNARINNYNYMASSWSVENGAYLRLKNIVLGYTFPSSFYKKLNNVVSNLRVYVSGADLWEVTKINDGWDPEATRTVQSGKERYPFNRTVTVGLNATF